jgi:hypothetical protein
LQKGQTRFSCTLKSVYQEGRDYVVVVGNDVYVLNGWRVELDKFAGGPATITGNLSDGKLTIESVTAAKKAAPQSFSMVIEFGSDKTRYRFDPSAGMAGKRNFFE